jgi:hypothetical protein
MTSKRRSLVNLLTVSMPEFLLFLKIVETNLQLAHAHCERGVN